MVSNNDIITAIILESSNEIQSFKRSWTSIHQFFYDISKTPGFSTIFEDLLFDTNGQSPFCEELDEILTELQSCDIIGSPNPFLKDYTIKIKKTNLNKDVFSFNPEVEELIKKIANEFSNKLKTS
jgi:hypothetical protein